MKYHQEKLLMVEVICLENEAGKKDANSGGLRCSSHLVTV